MHPGLDVLQGRIIWPQAPISLHGHLKVAKVTRQDLHRSSLSFLSFQVAWPGCSAAPGAPVIIFPKMCISTPAACAYPEARREPRDGGKQLGHDIYNRVDPDIPWIWQAEAHAHPEARREASDGGK